MAGRKRHIYQLSKQSLGRLRSKHREKCHTCGLDVQLGDLVVSHGGVNKKIDHAQCFESLFY